MSKKIFKIIISIILILIFIVSCNKILYTYNEAGDKIYNLKIFNNAEIIIPKPQTEGQSLSVIIKNEKNELIVFDGGRVEDADYLCKIIEENGGKVLAWYLTHIHDDHIGALYKILSDKCYNIIIKNLYYKFHDFSWYYNKIGNDAGILTLFENAVSEYNKDASDLSYVINAHNDINKGEVYNYNNVLVEILNNPYMLNTDPINNTSIVYKVYIDNKSLLILGDLGYEGGEQLLFDTVGDKLRSDIVFLSHHGQNGVSERFYYIVNPRIAIWPTSRSIFENTNGKYDTDNTKKWMENLKVRLNIMSYEGTTILK